MAAFVGRDAERKVLGEVLAAAKRGQAAVVQVVGEPGIGKTRLLGMFAQMAGDAGFAVRSSRGTEFDQDVPYGVLTELLEDLPVTAADVPESVEERYRRHRLVRQTLETASRSRALVVCLDDAHWADGGSLDCWAHLVRRLPSAPVVLVMAHRAQPLPANLDAALSDAHRAGVGQRLELGPLEFADALELIGRERGPSWRQAVYEASGGNPLYLESLVRMGGAELPSTIRAALKAEIDVLDETTRTVAWAAAVVGDPFEPEVMAEIAEMPEQAVLTALNVLCIRDVVRQADPRRFQFRHPLVRQVVYDAVAPGWRLAAHERAVAVLTGRGSPLLVRAYHVERSARFGDLDAVRTLLAAAEQSMFSSPVTAAHWLRAALRVLPENSAARRSELTVLLAQALTHAGRLREAREVLRGQRVPILSATINRLLGYHAEARQTLTDELARASGNDRHTLELELAAVSMMHGTLGAESRRVIERVVEQAHDRPLVVAAAGMALMAAFLTGDEKAIEIRAPEAARMVDELADEDLARRLDAVVWLSWGELHHQRWDNALRHVDRGLRLARGTGQIHLLTYLLAARACALRWLGDLPEATDCAEDAVEAAMLSGSAELEAMAQGMRCWIAILAGDLEIAVRAGAAAAAAGEDIGWWATIGRLLHAIAKLAMDPAADVSGEVLAAGGGPDLSIVDPFSKPLWYSFLATADLSQGRMELARQWAERTDRFSATFPVQRGVARLTAARIAAVDDPPLALSHAQAAVEAFRQGKARLEVAEALLLTGTVSSALGRREQALAALVESADEFAACGARRSHAQALAALRRLGKRVPSFDAAQRRGESGLTPRERDVARMLAEGRTNKQIAEHLVISLKTVETHVTHILAKLGVANRTSAVAMLRDQG